MPNTSTGIVGVITLYLTLSVSNVLAVPDLPRRFDMFRHLSCKDELVRVDNYSSQLAKLKDVLAVVGNDKVAHKFRFDFAIGVEN